MNKSETIGKLALALSKAQAEMPEVKKNAQNPFLKNKYADLGAVIETSRPVLAKHELAVTQFPVSDGEKIGVTTLLAHSSGEWLEESILISATDAKGLSFAQSAGVVISYLRRYAWASILGMYADEDTDGHTGRNSEPTKNSGKIAQTMTLEKALLVRDGKGELYSDKTIDALQKIVNSPEAPQEKKDAAKLLIEQKKEGK